MSKKSHNPIVGITVGDLNGIGPELILRTFEDNGLLNFCTPIIYGSAQTIIYHKKLLNIKNFNFQIIEDADKVHHNKINFINAWDDEVKIEIGTSSYQTGQAAAKAIIKAADDLVAGKLNAVVTAPINKETVQSANFNFPGHTEFFAHKSNDEQPLMLMVGESLKIAVVTGHIPLNEVSSAINKKKIVAKIKILNQSLIQDFSIERPKVAVLGLNPHAGENGILGNEEQEIINSAIEEANRQGMLAFGPFPADGFFGTCQYKQFDATLAMYHDQGLVPFKLLEFEHGVNYTAGLSIIRTSPDHGTAYSIAGKNKASLTSFIESIHLATKIFKNRAIHREMNENTLQTKIEREKERS